MIAVCLYLFPLLLRSATPACELILSKLDWIQLATFYPLLFRYLQSTTTVTEMYLLTSSVVKSCVKLSSHLTFSPQLEYLHSGQIAKAANSNPEILYSIAIEAISLSGKSPVYMCLYNLYPVLHSAQQSSNIEQIEFNPANENIVTVVYDDGRKKRHSLAVYKLNKGLTIAQPLLIFRGRHDFDGAKCPCSTNVYATHSFLSASWNPNGTLLAVFESTDRFSIAYSAQITFFSLQADILRRLDFESPTFGRINLIQRPQSFSLHLWQSPNSLLIANADQDGQLTSINITTTSDFAKVTSRTIEKLSRLSPLCDPAGVLQGRSCCSSDLNKTYFQANHLAPYGYWLINERDLITCEQCVVRSHLNHSTLMLKRLNNDSSPQAFDTVVFPEHRVHDAAVRSDMPNRLLLLIGSAGAGNRMRTVFNLKESVMYTNTSNLYEYKCEASEPWLYKAGNIDSVHYALVSLTVPSLELEILSQSYIPFKRPKVHVSNYDHVTTLTFVGQSATHLVARECCKVEDHPCPLISRFYIFSKFGDEIREMTNNIYIPSPHSRYLARLQARPKEDNYSQVLSIVVPHYILADGIVNDCSHSPASLSCLHCKRKMLNVEAELQFPPLKCMTVIK